ncbi:glycosyltransferase, partial [Coprococcus eutactus]|uniref:glycosyltransferase family 2 protein n=1 Tax=Coprococcus eutactus TaxID=33043 RepID=UPI00210D66B9
ELISVLNDYAEADNPICIKVNDNNIGLVKSLNKALSQGNGEYIVRMDADDISLPETIAHQIDYINNKKYDLV